MIPPPSEAVTAFLHACSPADCTDFMEKMNLFAALLYEANKSFNLTAIQPEVFWSKHVADSLSPAFAMPDYFRNPKRICDLGCGAGFPSLVLAAAFPHCTFTPVDSTRKKIDFVSAAAEKLGLRNLKAVHARGNELERKAPFRHAYDSVTARAVARLAVLAEYGLPFVRIGGALVAYKAADCGEEIKEAGRAIKLLGGEIERTDEIKLTDDITRTIIVVRKTSPSPKGYPRKGNKPRLSPLV